MNAFDVPLILLYTKLPSRSDFSQVTYIVYEQAGKKRPNLQDVCF